MVEVVCIPNALRGATVTPSYSIRQKTISLPPNPSVLLKYRTEISDCNRGLNFLLISFGIMEFIMITAVHSVADIFT